MEPAVYNVLVLGETQSGKSTLIEYMRKYANPNVKINTDALGTGFLSHTTDINITTIPTDLPEYSVTNKSGVKVDYGDFMKYPDEYDYEDAINVRKGFTSTIGDPRLLKQAKFNLIDTPGLNATGGDDEAHVQKIFNGLIKAKTIHLLIITISSGPFTQGLQDAIRCYVDMFPDFNGIIAFVHTHFDYKNFHPARTQVSHAIGLRMERLHTIMGRKTFPHFKIDCDIYNKKPIRECITQNTIQKILELATFNRPVDMLHTVINKTRKMRDIDNILRDKFEATSATIEKTLRFKVPEEGDLLTEIFRRETRIHKLDARIKVLDEYLVRHDVEVPEILHEERIDKDFEIEGEDKSITIRYPATGELDFAIDHRDLLHRNVKINEEIGSKEDKELWKSWQGNFERTSPQNAVLHVKIYTAKSNIHQADIVQKREEHRRLVSELQVTIRHRDHHARQNERMKEQIKEIVASHSEGIQILGLVTNEYLTPKIFADLMAAEAYMGDTAKCAMKVQGVYKEIAKQNQKTEQVPPDQDSCEPNVPQSLPETKHSILFLGEMQSGKSCLIEHLRKYADPRYTIDQTLIGDGDLPKTTRTRMFHATSNLLPYEVCKTTATIEADRLSKGPDKDDSFDSVELKSKMSYLDDMEFQFLDTPGFYNQQDEDNAHADIVEGMRSARYFNLIVIVINFSKLDCGLALEYYAKLLNGLQSNLAFVFTHAGDGDYSHTKSKQRLFLADIVSNLSRLFPRSSPDGSESHPTFTIGLTEDQSPATQCTINNTLRDVLMLAASNLPVEVDNILSEERIKSLTRPSSFDDSQQDRAPFEEPRSQSQVVERPTPPASTASGGASIPSVGTFTYENPGYQSKAVEQPAPPTYATTEGFHTRSVGVIMHEQPGSLPKSVEQPAPPMYTVFEDYNIHSNGTFTHEGPGSQEKAFEKPSSPRGTASEGFGIISIGDTKPDKLSPTGTAKLATEAQPGWITTGEHALQGRTSPADKTFETLPPTAKYSVLVLGKTQNGKSDLIDYLSKYPDMTSRSERCHTSSSPLKIDNKSELASTTPVRLLFCGDPLPPCEVVEVPNKSVFLDGTNVGAEDDYRGLLVNERGKGCQLHRVPQGTTGRSPSELVEMTFLDTTGLDDGDIDDGDKLMERHDNVKNDKSKSGLHFSKYFSDMVTSRLFNLILVTVSARRSITPEYKSVLEYYAKVLHKHRNVALLYTHVDYTDCPHSNAKFCACMSTRNENFRREFQMDHAAAATEEMKHFALDLNMEDHPIVKCQMHNTVREILNAAVNGSPQGLHPIQIKCLSLPGQRIQAYREKPSMQQQTETGAAIETEGQAGAKAASPLPYQLDIELDPTSLKCCTTALGSDSGDSWSMRAEKMQAYNVRKED
ncbi:hypothetical protein CPC16_003741 [Podila verticillata]|nr:hypothetical protein CPC16_003741 [Podila verticillata]